MQPIMDVAALEAFLASDFPQVNEGLKAFHVVSVAPGAAVMRLDAGERHLRPGGTVSGPTLFALADVSAYVAILAHIGPVALAVTTNLSINFLRKPLPGPLLATARILKLGRRLAVTEVSITSGEAGTGGEAGDLVAHATATYSIPPRNEVL